MNYLQPVIVVLLSIPLLGERPSRRLLLSGGLVLMGVHLAERVAGYRVEAISQKS